jgi:hypothetical protein
MTSTDKIITLARQYCLDLFKSGMSTEQSIAKGLLNGVEYLVGRSFVNDIEVKNEIIHLAQASLKEATSGYSKEGHLRKIELERKKFIEYVEHLDVNGNEHIEPLPYRRRLLKSESKAIRENLKCNWNFDGGYWEPLTKCSNKPFYFYDTEYLDNQDYEKLIAILKKFTDKAFEITEDRLDYEIDTSEFDKDSIETIYTDKNNNWIVYISHEGTIAFGGLELMKELDEALANKVEFKNKW